MIRSLCECESIWVDDSLQKRGFEDWTHYEEFKKTIEHNLLFKKIPVLKKYSHGVFDEEYWFCCINCHIVWRLVRPDPPFKGVFEKVNE